MKELSNFHTLKGYERIHQSSITSSMEDYLEMIYRIQQNGNIVRINILAKNLNVRPSSASKMIGNLKKAGFVNFQPYGYIELTKKGTELGQYLLHRHYLLNKLLCYINNSEDELEQVEKIEHFINPTTIKNIEKFFKNK